ncbi:MAG TPA: response regulator [Myxococcaceae bacterium]|nr:response regulator [Myxococcaceae bacterium]
MPKTLLVADDSLTVRKVIGMVLALEDFQITAVDNGIDAIARAREMRPDLVIADVLMPGRSGYEVCETLKSDPATASTPVLLLAGNFEPFDEARARAARADAHLTKPFESQAFLDRVRMLVGLPAGQPMMPPRPAVAAPPPQTSQPAVPRPSQPMASAAPRPAATGAFAPAGAPRPAPTAGVPQPMPGPAGIPRPAGPAPTPMAGVPRPAPQPVARPVTQPGVPMGRPTGAAPAGLPRPPQPMTGGTVPGMTRPGMSLGTQSGFARPAAPMTPGGFPRAPGAAPLPPVPAGPTSPGAARGRDPFGLSAPATTPVRGYQVEQQIAPPAAAEEMSLDLGSEPAAAADGGEAQLREALGRASREVIEKIAWEVVPQLAETIVREIAERTMRERDGKG